MDISYMIYIYSFAYFLKSFFQALDTFIMQSQFKV